MAIAKERSIALDVLRGYLVSGLAMREYDEHRDFRPLRFLGRRAFKIYPGLYACLLARIALGRMYGEQLRPSQILGEALFLKNYWDNVLDITWSLAVEEHFYLLLAVVMWRSLRRGGPQGEPLGWLPRAFLGLAAVTLLCRMATVAWSAELSYGANLAPTHLRLDALSFGVLLRWLQWRRPAWLRERYFTHEHWLLPAAAVALAPTLWIDLEHSAFLYGPRLSLTWFGFGVLLLAFLFRFPATIPFAPLRGAVRMLAFVGVHSYPIYLWHLTVFLAFPLVATSQFGMATGYLTASFGGIAVAVAVGFAASWTVEIPFLRLRERLLPPRAAPPRL